MFVCDARKDANRGIKQKAGQSLIELKNAGFTYGGRDILSEMTLCLQPGSFHFLTGPSGSGKTTLLNLCYQALLPTTGMVRMFEQDVRAMTRDDIAKMRRRIGVVHQNCQFLDHLSVRDNLALPLSVSRREDDIHPSNLDDLLGWVGLTERGDAMPPELSGGERQRAALAANGQVIGVLRLIGAWDVYIARAFVRRFTLRALIGACVGTVLAMIGVLFMPAAAEEGASLTGLGFKGWHWILPFLIPPLAAFVAFWATRWAAFRTLSRLS